MINKSKELRTQLTLVNNRLHFTGEVKDNKPISIDYIPPLGDNLGYTSLELLLLSLTSCLGSAVLTFLRRMNKTIDGCAILATGARKEEHPTGFSKIHIEIHLTSQDVTDADMLKVINLSENGYCPVWSMLKGNVEIDINFSIGKTETTQAGSQSFLLYSLW